VTRVISRQYQITPYIIIARKDSQIACTEKSECSNISEDSRHVMDSQARVDVGQRKGMGFHHSDPSTQPR
jgi:hypothetical protein